DVGRALVDLVVIESWRADDDVRVAVSVHVPGARNGGAELRGRLVGLGRPRGRRAEPRGGPQVDERATFVRLTVVVLVGTADDVAVALPVHVPRARDRIAEPRFGLVALRGPGRRDRQARGRTQVDEDAALVGLAVVEECGADDHVAEPVPVDVPRGGDGDAEVRALLVAVRAPGGRDGGAGRRSGGNGGGPLVGLAVGGDGRADDRLAEAVRRG